MHDELVIPNDLSIPGFLKQKDTPARKASREALVKVTKNARHAPQGESRRAQLTEADRLVIEELQAGASATRRAKVASRIAKLLANKSGDASKMPLTGKEALKAISATKGEDTMSMVGQKESALRAQRAGTHPKPSLSKLAEQIQTGVTSQKAALKDAVAAYDGPVTKVPPGKTTKKVALEKARQAHLEDVEKATAVKPKKTPKTKLVAVAKNGEMQQKALKAMQRKHGITNPDMIEMFGKRLHVRVLEKWAIASGLKFKIDESGDLKHYCAV